jgi:hypothetical protein
MKRSTLILCFAVWSISLITAYYVGSRGESAPVAIPAPSTPQATLPKANATKADDVKTTVTPQATALDAYLSGEDIPLNEALRDISILSAQASLDLLDQAFALPTSDPNRSRLIQELLGQLAETEPMAALELASQITSLRDSERARISVLEVWGRNDPAAAMAWATNALSGEPTRARISQLSAIYRGFAESSPAAAFQQALQIQDDNRLRNRLLGEVIETQIESGGLMAAKLAVDLVTDPDTQNALRRELVDEWAEFDPQAAAQYVLSLGEDAPENLKTTLVSEWAESDPAAAAAWLSNLPEGDPAIARASASIIQEWTRYDLAASAEWLNSLPASPELDRAVISYTFRAAEEDPGTAMTWAASIDNDRRRSWMMERVAATWKEQDAETFKAYLDSSELDEEQRKKLENAQPNSGGWGRGRN